METVVWKNSEDNTSTPLRAILHAFLIESNCTCFNCHSPTTMTSEIKLLAMGNKEGKASTAVLAPTTFLQYPSGYELLSGCAHRKEPHQKWRESGNSSFTLDCSFVMVYLTYLNFSNLLQHPGFLNQEVLIREFQLRLTSVPCSYFTHSSWVYNWI